MKIGDKVYHKPTGWAGKIVCEAGDRKGRKVWGISLDQLGDLYERFRMVWWCYDSQRLILCEENYYLTEKGKKYSQEISNEEAIAA